MGGSYANMNIHICGLEKNDIKFYESQMKSLNILFSVEEKNKSTLNYKVKSSKKPKWNAFIYSDNNTKNFKLINQTIQDQINKFNTESKKRKISEEEKGELINNMILFYVTDNESDFLLLEEFNNKDTIDFFADNFPLILFIFKNNNRDNTYYKDKFFDFSYIRCLNFNSLFNIPKIKSKKEKKEVFQALFLKSFLYNNYNNYFTQKGYKVVDEINPLFNRQMHGIYLPIVLVGSPGIDKSTFINIINGTRISKPSSSDAPVTSKSVYYDIKIPGQKNDEFQDMDEGLYQEAFFRLIDTPGIDLEKNIDNPLNEIKNIFKNYKDGKENIPIILYFMNPIEKNSNKDENKQTKTMEILKFLAKNNAKIIFVITHISKNSSWSQQSSYINSLKENGLENLVEKDQSNIIKCDLVGSNPYGIQDIFKKIYLYLNILKDEKGNPTGEVYTDSFIEEIKKFEAFDQKLKYIKTKTHLFDQFESKEDIITYGNKKTKILIGSMMVTASAVDSIPVAFADDSIIKSIIGNSIIQIGNYYGYARKKITKSDLNAIYSGKLYEPNNLKEEFNNINQFFKFSDDLIDESNGIILCLNADDIVKSVWGIGTIFGIMSGTFADAGIALNNLNKTRKYFESKYKADDGNIFFITRCFEYEIIFGALKQFEDYHLIYPNGQV